MTLKEASVLKTASTPDGSNLAQAVERELAAAEAKLARLLDSHEALISEICHYLVDGRGKRLRPLFILLVYRACGGTDAKLEDAIDAAIALELIHSATLLHDDIIDGGTMRRGKASAFSRYGLGPTMVAGDFLFCRAFELCGRFDEHLVHTAARACIQLTEGEVMEGRMRHNATMSLSEYMTVIGRKTASLFAAGGRVAADIAGVAPTVAAAMERLGSAIGLAFQMIDDLLDVLGPENKIGKPVGSDLRAGIPSLPVVLTMGADPELRRMFADGGNLDGAEFRRALEIVRSPKIVESARAMAAAQTAAAREALAMLPPSVYRQSLRALIDEQLDRDV